MVSRIKDRQRKSRSISAKKKIAAKAKRSSASRKKNLAPGVPRCGLCGATENLAKTECCGQWICDDEESYVLFSYARNSCWRNHRRYTLCGYHFCEGHEGSWKDCKECLNSFEDELEMYVYYGTNEYNFEVLENPPKYKPTKCSRCGAIIRLADGGYSTSAKDGYLCFDCTSA
ncbi:MAG: hypothetical protein WD738_24785 [Pirellulales bacterium]